MHTKCNGFEASSSVSSRSDRSTNEWQNSLFGGLEYLPMVSDHSVSSEFDTLEPNEISLQFPIEDHIIQHDEEDVPEVSLPVVSYPSERKLQPPQG